ncbi:hypothetical protein U1839_17165 [Sphingomonas sp. RT2P30]|uniref:hypothetical protein n=1 Tax=Parasphingomonas halimpatiens TaxID=3096162 RepID=UPI002FCB1169
MDVRHRSFPGSPRRHVTDADNRGFSICSETSRGWGWPGAIGRDIDRPGSPPSYPSIGRTMMQRAFYRRVWRFNALVIAAFGIVGILAAVAVLVAVLIDVQSRFAPHGVFRGDRPRSEAVSGDVPTFTKQERVEGTPFLAMTIGAKNPDGSLAMVGSSRSGDQAERNVLLLDLRNGDTRYVLPNNDRPLVQWDVLSSAGPDGKSVGRAYVALVGNAGSSKYDVLIGTVATGKQLWAARGVTALDVPNLVDDGTIGFVVWNGNAASYHLYGLDDLKERMARPLPLLAAGKTG